eukprot:scaffold1634_cov137-Amphora_coffeaeformis.AAC.9
MTDYSKCSLVDDDDLNENSVLPLHLPTERPYDNNKHAMMLVWLAFLVLVALNLSENVNVRTLKKQLDVADSSEPTISTLPTMSTTTSTPNTIMTIQPSFNPNLVVFDAVGRKTTTQYVRYNFENHFAQGWDCLVFIYVNETELPADEPNLVKLEEHGCNLIRTPHVYWGTFLQYVPPAMTDHYDYLALVLDDVYAPAADAGVPNGLNVTAMLGAMEKFGFGTISPRIEGNHHPRQMSDNTDCIGATGQIETFLQFFTADAWRCFYSMLSEDTRKGWCLDECSRIVCPDLKQGIDFRQTAYHVEDVYDKKQKIWKMPQEALTEAQKAGIEFERPVRNNESGYYSDKTGLALCKKLHCNELHEKPTLIQETCIREGK